jgi:hypothetical protein
MSQEVRSPAEVLPSESIMLSYGFPVLSGMTHFCQSLCIRMGRMRIAVSHAANEMTQRVTDWAASVVVAQRAIGVTW